MAKLSPDEYISFSPANPTSHVYILADVNCPASRELHKMVPLFNAKGIEIRYVAAPEGSLAGLAWTKYRNIWCSSNPKQEFDAAMNGLPVPASSCSDNEMRTLAAQSTFMSAMPNTATPTTFFQDGMWITGTEVAVDLPEKANMGAKIVGQYNAR
jgi:thiol:disulfide interchange protein DsbC